MNTTWLHDRIVSILIGTAALIKQNGSNYELDQILLDSLRVYSSTYQISASIDKALLNIDRSSVEKELDRILMETLVSMDRPVREENLEKARKAVVLIKAHPEDIVSILEGFERL